MLRKISIVAAALALLPMTAMAGGKIVTKGEVSATPAGELVYPAGITGHARMIRTLSDDVGNTVVRLRVKGLSPGFEYPTHVHNGTCASGGGGHYQHEVGGAVDDVNEMWLTFTANSKGKAKSHAGHDHLAREDARSIVIHDHIYASLPKARIACVDLK